LPVLTRDLTRRQLDVLLLLCEGLPNKGIAIRLDISPRTVKAHVAEILRKLGVASRLQAVIAARAGHEGGRSTSPG
jgi:two-component system, NarL family, nitrate/nitrite response regulator NarL